MGQRMPPVPHIYGNDCLLGFPAGKTPKYMYARFSGIVKCPAWPRFPSPPNDRVFKLTQDKNIPCRWEYLIGSWWVQFWIVIDPLRVDLVMGVIEPDHGMPYFMNAPLGPIDEGYVYHNDQRVCNLREVAVGGICTVTWIHEATALLKSINMLRAEDLFMELRPLVDGNKVYKFCRLKDSTNIAIEFEPD